MTVMEGVRAAAPDLRNGLSDLRDAIPNLNLRELRAPTPAREALSDLRDAMPEARDVMPAVAAGLGEIRESLPTVPWARRRSSTPQRIVIVVVAGIGVLAAVWLIAAVIDRRRKLKIDRRLKLAPATEERQLLPQEPFGMGFDVPAALDPVPAVEPDTKVRRGVDEERVLAPGRKGTIEAAGVATIEP